eukprot:TRINITY_DN19280_c1_g1_i1.p1 TRINITY_DN19280_c1_g1~~TRINITY_DN19280_c1_g1_i1.p1  ORF type:complete len:345 (+),score=43.22 TRINITY_DN19280_c1_g1_i1:32-1036(+)
MDAAALISSLHGMVLRRISDATELHFNGLREAARNKKVPLSNGLKRKLTQLDFAHDFARHITRAKCNELFAVISDALAASQLDGIRDPTVTQQEPLPHSFAEQNVDGHVLHKGEEVLADEFVDACVPATEDFARFPKNLAPEEPLVDFLAPLAREDFAPAPVVEVLAPPSLEDCAYGSKNFVHERFDEHGASTGIVYDEVPLAKPLVKSDARRASFSMSTRLGARTSKQIKASTSPLLHLKRTWIRSRRSMSRASTAYRTSSYSLRTRRACLSNSLSPWRRQKRDQLSIATLASNMADSGFMGAITTVAFQVVKASTSRHSIVVLEVPVGSCSA